MKTSAMKKNLAEMGNNVPKTGKIEMFHKVNYYDDWKMALLDSTFLQLIKKKYKIFKRQNKYEDLKKISFYF